MRTLSADGIAAKAEVIDTFLDSMSDQIATMGERLAAWKHGDAEKRSPRISERWLTALHWYGKGLRESGDVSAIIAYGAALDIFGRSAGNVSLISKFCSGAFRIPETQIILRSLSLRTVVAQIYAEGRSQLSHGGRPILSTDYRGLRQLAQSFVQLMLRAAHAAITDFVALRRSNEAIKDDFPAFLKMISARATR